jgi:signal transduction histidine kinase/transcriptional regulator with GAF, ATPase, and Fis domain
MQHVVAVRVLGEPVAFVCGPQFRLEASSESHGVFAAYSLGPEEGGGEGHTRPTRLQKDVESLAAQLARRCTSERGLYILNETIRNVCSLLPESDAWDTLLDSIEVLFGSPTVCGYQLERDAKLYLRGQRGKLSAYVQEVIELGAEEDAGLAAFGRKTVWNEANGRVAVPMLAGPNVLAGVVVVASPSAAKISRTERQAIEILANTTALALEWTRAEKNRSGSSSSPGPKFSQKALAFAVRGINDGVDRTVVQRDLFQALADEACNITPASRSNVRMYNRVAGELRTVAVRGDGWTKEKRDDIFRTNELSGASRAVNTRVSHLIPDVSAEKYYRKVFPDTFTQFSIPIFLRDEVLAVLVVQSTLPGAFTEDLQNKLTACVKQCEEVFERYYGIQEGWLYDLEKEIRNEPDIGVICRASVSHVRKLLGVRASSIFLMNRSATALELAASTSLHSSLPGTNLSYDIGEGLTGWVAKTGRILRLSDAANEQERAAVASDLHWKQKHAEAITYDDAIGHWTFLAAPLIAVGRVIGVVRATIKKDKADFDWADESMIARIANLLATIISGIRSKDESERRIDRLGSLLNFSNRLATTLEMSTLCHNILEEVRSITGCVVGHLRVLNPATKALTLEWAEGPQKDLVPRVRKKGEGVAGFVADTQTPLFLPRVVEDERWRSAAAELAAGKTAPWVVSGACLPLIAGDDLVGTILLEWSRETDFDEDYQSHLKALAGRCASAVKTALDYREMVKTLSRIRNVGMEFTGTRSVELVLQKVLDAILEEAGIDSGVIRFRDTLRNKWVLRAARSTMTPDLRELLNEELDIADDILSEILKSAKAIYLENAPADERFQKLLGSQKGTELQFLQHIRSLVLLPIWHEHCLGFVSLVSSGFQKLNPARIEYLEILVGHAAYAFENARAAEEDLITEPLRIMGSMLGANLHEFRNPLHDILLAVGVIEHRGRDLGSLREPENDIRKSVREMQSACGKLERFARSGVMELLDVEPVVIRALNKFRPRANDKGVTTDPFRCGDLPHILANRDQIEDIVSLLLQNALEATPAGGRIKVMAESIPEHIVLTIEDNGAGMSREVLAKCNLPGFSTRVDRTGTRRGMGLTIVFSLVKHNGGEIRIESQEDKGTKVNIYLPRKEVTNA